MASKPDSQLALPPQVGGSDLRSRARHAISGVSPMVVVLTSLTIALVVVALTTAGFWTATNIRSILLEGALVGILAAGLTPIVVSGSVLSLSLGVTAAVSATAFIYFLRLGTSVAVVLTVAVGAIACGVQGLIVGAYGANPIIVTIGGGVLLTGVTEWLTGGATVSPPPGVHYGLLHGLRLGVPVAFYVLVIVVVLIELVLRRTAFGKEMGLVGENKAAARAAALPVGRVITGAFLIAGVCAGATGILLGATNQSADLNLQANYSFDAIAAVLVVGTPIAGGHGSAARSAIGALGIAVISSLVVLRGYSTGVQTLVEGVIVLVVVTAAHLARRRTATQT